MKYCTRKSGRFIQRKSKTYLRQKKNLQGSDRREIEEGSRRRLKIQRGLNATITFEFEDDRTSLSHMEIKLLLGREFAVSRVRVESPSRITRYGGTDATITKRTLETFGV